MKPTLSPKQREKDAYHDGFRAACTAMRRVFSAAEYKDIRYIIDGMDHAQGDPFMVRWLRSELRRAKKEGVSLDEENRRKAKAYRKATRGR
jgi:hypothetical protein